MKKTIIGLLLITILLLAGRSVFYLQETEEYRAPAEEYCQESNIEGVYDCGGYIKLVSSTTEEEASYYREDGIRIECPIVEPDLMSQECKDIIQIEQDEIECIQIC